MPLDPDAISASLASMAQSDVARKRGKHLKPFRGLRGTPIPATTRLLASLWRKDLSFEQDGEALHALFCTAHEDGLVAIGLTAALVPDDAMGALEMVDRWQEMIDDTETADFLGWMVLGPALMASGEPVAQSLAAYRDDENWGARRMALMAGLALMPIALQGACAAALRQRMGIPRLQFVAEPQGPAIEGLLDAYVRDDNPRVRKAFIRVARSWAEYEPLACEAWIGTVKGGMPKRLREELERGIRKGKRNARRAAEAALLEQAESAQDEASS
ncbi:MAG: DNA alkylation repair protein [Myxococcota bacterium]|nr:DNA alkylation repair protein [Myxococcota bacterium]